MTSAPPQAPLTPAREAVLRRVEALAGAERLPAFAEERRAAARLFAERGFPNRRVEEFRSTDLSRLERHPLAAPAAAARTPTVARTTEEGGSISFENGRLAAAALPPGVRILPLAEAAAADPALAGAPPDLAGEPPAALIARALHEEAWVLDVAAGSEVQGTIRVAYDLGPESAGALVATRLVVRVGDGARVRVVLESRGGREETLFLPLETALLRQNAALSLVRLVDDAPGVVHLARTLVRVARDARFESVAVTLGGALHRHDLAVELADEGAEARLDGLYLARGDGHVDHHTFVDHAAPHTTSRSLYKGVLADRSRGVFFGKVLVRQDAQKIDADQKNENLLLSDRALAESTPQLEIYADDVQCRHGSTIGQIEDEPIFYLRTRGIGLVEARALLVLAFGREITERVPDPRLRETLEERLTAFVDGAGD